MHAPSIWGILIVAVVVILLFGRGKIAGLMGEVASGIKSFQRGMREEDKPVEQLDARTTVNAADIDRSKDA